MFSKIIISTSVAVLLLGRHSNAQKEATASHITELKVGDWVPDLPINNIINYSKTTASLSDFADKVIILDFWATSCSGCIQKLPMLDSLQRKYPNEIQVFPVTFEPASSVYKMLKNNSKLKNSTLPFVTSDKLLSAYFRHLMIPHVVWIKGRKVQAITQAEYVTDPNIEELISGKKIEWNIKEDLIGVKVASSLVDLKSGIPKTAFYYSSLIPFIPGLPPANGLQILNERKAIRIYAINNNILSLYASTLSTDELSNEIPLYYKQIEFKVADSSRYIFDNKMYLDQWERQNCYCYDATFPTTYTIDEIKEKVRQHLNTYLNLQCSVGEVKTKCIVLSASLTTKDKLLTKGAKRNIHFTDVGEKQFVINTGMSDVVRALNWQPLLPLVIDSTGIDYKMDLELGVFRISDTKSLMAAFEQKGIKATIQYVSIKKLILKEK